MIDDSSYQKAMEEANEVNTQALAELKRADGLQAELEKVNNELRTEGGSVVQAGDDVC